MAKMKLNILGEKTIKRGDGKKLKFSVFDENGKPYDLSNSKVRWIVKEKSKIEDLDSNSLAHEYFEGEVLKDSKGTILIHLKPSVTKNFPITEKEPLILAIQISDPVQELSSEFLFHLWVERSVFSSLY